MLWQRYTAKVSCKRRSAFLPGLQKVCSKGTGNVQRTKTHKKVCAAVKCFWTYGFMFVSDRLVRQNNRPSRKRPFSLVEMPRKKSSFAECNLSLCSRDRQFFWVNNETKMTSYCSRKSIGWSCMDSRLMAGVQFGCLLQFITRVFCCSLNSSLFLHQTIPKKENEIAHPDQVTTVFHQSIFKILFGWGFF